MRHELHPEDYKTIGKTRVHVRFHGKGIAYEETQNRIFEEMVASLYKDEEIQTKPA